ncbi:hypothetical protein ES705_31631 [subsurface metagenome]
MNYYINFSIQKEKKRKNQKIVRGRRKLLLKIIPEKIELLDYDFVKLGYSRLQILEFNKML